MGILQSTANNISDSATREIWSVIGCLFHLVILFEMRTLILLIYTILLLLFDSDTSKNSKIKEVFRT